MQPFQFRQQVSGQTFRKRLGWTFRSQNRSQLRRGSLKFGIAATIRKVEITQQFGGIREVRRFYEKAFHRRVGSWTFTGTTELEPLLLA
jgi:hypothetical protein